MSLRFDVAIIGSGFSGSILARILAMHGRRVCLIDAATHPRFAIGESSTPIADWMLRRIGQQYGLDDLVALSTYGTWQQSRPELACGLKRGFSYFDHRMDRPEHFLGEQSLVVAASPNDQRSDTHWYRSEVDSYLFQKAVGSGVQARQSEKVTAIKLADDGRSRIQLESGAFVEAELIVDASGAAAVSAALLGTPAITSRMRTSTCAAFAHFRDVKSFSEVFNRRHNDSRADDPFDADDAAQHHLIHDGWVWMLRMNNGITSVGVTAPIGGKGRLAGTAMAQKVETEAVRVLSNRFESFPMLHQVMCDSEIVAPASGILRITRVQRFFDPLVAPNCVMLPTASVTIDPLHSTGIAHAMAGVSRIAEWILQGQSAVVLQDYRNAVLDEAMLIDRMVAMAYWSMPSFQRFCAACMVYFSAAIGCEERIAGGDVPTVFWQAGDDRFVDAVRRCDDVIRSSQDDQSVISTVREIIAPWNSVGLFESPANRYAYTATK